MINNYRDLTPNIFWALNTDAGVEVYLHWLQRSEKLFEQSQFAFVKILSNWTRRSSGDPSDSCRAWPSVAQTQSQSVAQTQSQSVAQTQSQNVAQTQSQSVAQTQSQSVAHSIPVTWSYIPDWVWCDFWTSCFAKCAAHAQKGPLKSPPPPPPFPFPKLVSK